MSRASGWAMTKASAVVICGFALAASAPAAPDQRDTGAELTAAGERALAEYDGVLRSLRAELTEQLPRLDWGPAPVAAEVELPKVGEHANLDRPEADGPGGLQLDEQKPPPPTPAEVFHRAHHAERGTGKDGERKGHDYSNVKAAMASIEAARPLLAEVDGFLADDALDAELARCAVLANATPRRLAAFAQQSPEHKKLVDDLLADPVLMKEMLIAGGAKDGRYHEAMRVFREIQAASEHAHSGELRRLALATALELAAPEMCGYQQIDPAKRYRFFEQAYLDRQLDPAFGGHSTWLYRHVVNDPQSEADMAWMREMLGNYRPDFITAPEGYRARYVGLMHSEFGHKRPEWDDDSPHSRMQQAIDRGGQCGPKAFFGRSLSRGFGVPTWGARLRSHTAMTYWTPRGWTTILGVGWHSGFWTADAAEPMRAKFFRLDAMARGYPGEYVKACRAQWVGDVLGEEDVSGMESGTGGLWNALALNKKRAIVADRHPTDRTDKRPWEIDPYTDQDPWLPEQLTEPAFKDSDRRVTVDDSGVITIPAAACAGPKGNTSKIVFMRGRDGRMQLHYKRFELPEPFKYRVDVTEAGSYLLSMNVVTVNREQFFMLTDAAGEAIRVSMPYTVGRWADSDPVKVTLAKGENTLEFTRTAPDDFVEQGWSGAGPEHGGISLRSVTLTPVE